MHPVESTHIFRTETKQSLTDGMLLDLLRHTATLLDGVHIVIDAMNESSDREELVEYLNTIRSWGVPQVHLSVTGRDEVELRDGFEGRLSAGEKFDIQTAGQDQDIKDYVTTQLSTDNRLRMWETLRDLIETKLVDGAKGMSVEDSVHQCL